MSKVLLDTNFLFGKESSKKKTSKNFEMKVNSISKFDYKVLILLFGAFTLSFISTFSAFAEDLNYSVSVEPALNIATSSSKVSLDLNPLTKPFDSQDLKVSVSTNNETGYKLYVNTSTTDLIEKNDSNLTIKTLDSEVPENEFTVNKWGYKLNTDNYLPFKSGTLINSSKVAIENNSSTLTFAAKIDYETKAGTYNLALNFQATANPHIKTIADAEYMQEVDSKATGGCSADLVTGQVYQLKDSRDNEVYNIARLADGNCWMLDNLRLGITDISADLTSSDTNLPTAITVSASDWNSYRKNGSIIYNNYTEPMFDSSYADIVTTAYGSSSGKIGVYYNFCAATAKTYCKASDSGTTDATYDICPSGWRMPTGGPNGEYQALSTAYNNNATNFANALGITLSGGRGGNTGPSEIDLSFYNWSSTRYTNSTMYSIAFVKPSSLYPAHNGGSRTDGITVRCVLK